MIRWIFACMKMSYFLCQCVILYSVTWPQRLWISHLSCHWYWRETTGLLALFVALGLISVFTFGNNYFIKCLQLISIYLGFPLDVNPRILARRSVTTKPGNDAFTTVRLRLRFVSPAYTGRCRERERERALVRHLSVCLSHSFGPHP